MLLRRQFGLALAGLLLAPRLASASTTFRVMTSGAFTAPFEILGARFTAETGHRI